MFDRLRNSSSVKCCKTYWGTVVAKLFLVNLLNLDLRLYKGNFRFFQLFECFLYDIFTVISQRMKTNKCYEKVRLIKFEIIKKIRFSKILSENIINIRQEIIVLDSKLINRNRVRCLTIGDG